VTKFKNQKNTSKCQYCWSKSKLVITRPTTYRQVKPVC